jgi:hypothetical protein
MSDQTLEEIARTKLEDPRKAWDDYKIEAGKKAREYVEIAAEVLQDRAKEKLEEVAGILLPSLEVLAQGRDTITQALPADLKDQIAVISEHLNAVGAVIAEVALLEIVRQHEIDAKEQIVLELLKVQMTSEDHEQLTVRENANNAERHRFDVKLSQLQAHFDERHPDSQTADTKRLQDELQRKFDELRRQQELAILADRMKLADARCR